jgi:hypothetical protein
MAESAWLGRPWLGQAWLVARTEFRRSVRKLRASGLRLAGLLLAGGFFALVAVGAAGLLVSLDPDVAGVTVPNGVRGTIAGQWLFALVILTQRVVSNFPRPDAEAFVLTTVPVRAAVLGQVLAETARALAYIGVPVVAFGGALAYVAGAPLLFLTVSLGFVLFVASVVAAAAALGYALKLLVARIPAVARNRSLLGGVAVIAFFGGYAAVQVQALDYSLLGWLPVGWLVDLAVVGSPIVGSPVRALVGGALTLGGSLLAVGLASRLAAELWLGDSVEGRVDHEQARVGTASDDPLAAALSPLAIPVGRPATRRVAQRTVLLARRAPVKLSFLLTPVVLGAVGLANVLASGDPTASLGLLAPALAVGLPWVTGAALALNPLGDEGRVLPVTLTALTDGRAYVRGVALPGVLYGVPLALVATPLATLLGTYTPLEVACLTLLAGVLALVSAALAPGIGVAFPRFDAVRVVRGRDLVPPRFLAIVLHALAVFGLGGLAASALLAPAATRGTLAFLVGGVLAFPFDLAAGQGAPATPVADVLRAVASAVAGVPTAALRWGGYAGPPLVGTLLALAAFRYARRRYETFRVD